LFHRTPNNNSFMYCSMKGSVARRSRAFNLSHRQAAEAQTGFGGLLCNLRILLLHYWNRSNSWF
jgi:hypothetical protein